MDRVIRSAFPERDPQHIGRSEVDDMGYQWIDVTERDGIAFNWIDISEYEEAQAFHLGDDANTGALELGFDFPFWDRVFDQVCLDTDGWMSFTYDGEDSGIYSFVYSYPREAADHPRNSNTVVILGGDYTEGTDIWFWTDGESRAIAQWSGNHQHQFEIIFHADGLAVMQYGPGSGERGGSVGVNLGDGDHGWCISPGGNEHVGTGMTIAFGPEAAWDFWLEVNPEFGTVAPGEEIEIELTIDPEGLDPDDYFSELVIISNDPTTHEVSFDISLCIADRFHPPPFYQESERFHTLSITELNFNNDPAPAHWEIGVFSPREVLSGAVVWEAEEVDLYAYAEEEDNQQFRDRDEFIFRVYDPEADEEYLAEATFFGGPEVWGDGAESEITLAAFSEHDISLQLEQGWNMISINVDPLEHYDEHEARGPDVELMWDDIVWEGENQILLLLKDENGNFWAPAWAFHNIPFWNLTDGYQILLREAREVTFSGRTIPADADIPMEEGWNMIAYFPDYELCADYPDFYVLSPIIDRVLLAKDVDGRFMSRFYMFSNMPPWPPGQGYMVKLSEGEPLTFNYPSPQEERDQVRNTDPPENRTTPSTGRNMSLLVNLISGQDVSDGDEIAAYSQSGQLVGRGAVKDGRCGLAVWGDDKTTDVVEGALDGEPFKLRICQASRGTEQPLEVNILKGEGLYYQTDEFVVLNAVIDTAIPQEYYLGNAYPNPFNSTLNISYGLPEAGLVSISIFDLSGRLAECLVCDHKTAGEYSITWKAGLMSSGVYMLRMESGNWSQSQKVMLVR